ncbi:hypothetical protein [Pseudoxanthomonas gei]|uniref:hypothetical protein n=1 Tax=Pseudoxanthomonas gei TaxID=1383030 RepID=UPI0013920602|nr:hypothetical protein [Pseudoxanthomonas gei]
MLPASNKKSIRASSDLQGRKKLLAPLDQNERDQLDALVAKLGQGVDLITRAD